MGIFAGGPQGDPLGGSPGGECPGSGEGFYIILHKETYPTLCQHQIKSPPQIDAYQWKSVHYVCMCAMCAMCAVSFLYASEEYITLPELPSGQQHDLVASRFPLGQ